MLQRTARALRSRSMSTSSRMSPVRMWPRHRQFEMEDLLLHTDFYARWDKPVYLSFLMEQSDLSDHLYDAMRQDDVSQAVMMASQLLKVTNKMPHFEKVRKCEEESNRRRKLGNEALQRNEFQITLECYNSALLFAPAGSREMKLAYSNRSALLFSLKKFTAALKDIETVFTLECPEDLVVRLRKRKIECIAQLGRERRAEKNSYMQEDFFSFNVERNPEIPCASSHVGVTFESGVPEIVALKHIEVGQLVVVEEAFISESGFKNQLSACHYCHKFDLNLIPCEKCCFALFCGSDCRSKCNEEYHAIECHIMEFLNQISEKFEYFGITIKAAIKIWKLTKDWSKVIKFSEEMGRKITKRSSKNDMCDAKNPFSLLNFNDEKPLNYGIFYNYSWLFAVVLHLLSEVPSFLPKNEVEKKKAVGAMARLSLGLRLFVPQILIQEAVAMKEYKKGGAFERYFRGILNHGYFSFASKLTHKCDANLITVGLNNKIALVAIKPIKRDEKLSLSYLQDVTVTLMDRRVFLYNEFHIVCSCHVCKPRDFNSSLNDTQKVCIAKATIMPVVEDTTTADGSKRYIKSLCNALTELSDVPLIPDHVNLIEELKKSMAICQVSRTRNMILGFN